VKINVKGQVVIPKPLRDKYGFKDETMIVDTGYGLEILPKMSIKEVIKRFGPIKTKVTEKEVMELREAWEES